MISTVPPIRLALALIFVVSSAASAGPHLLGANPFTVTPPDTRAVGLDLREASLGPVARFYLIPVDLSDTLTPGSGFASHQDEGMPRMGLQQFASDGYRRIVRSYASSELGDVVRHGDPDNLLENSFSGGTVPKLP